MHIVRERDATDAGPDAVVKLTVFESVLWRRVSQPPLGGAPARERRASSSSFSYASASAGGGIRGCSRDVVAGFRRRRWEPALLRGHSGFLPLGSWLSDCSKGARRWFATLPRRPGLGTEGRWCGSTGRMGRRGKYMERWEVARWVREPGRDAERRERRGK